MASSRSTVPQPPRRPAGATRPPPLWWYATVLRRLRPSGSRLLQVECGDGELLQLLAEHFDTFGFDVRPKFRSRCRLNVPNAVVLEDWDERPEDGFDVVVSIGEFGQRGARAQVRGLLPGLARGGILVLIVPNPSGWGARLKGRQWRERWQGAGEPLLSPGEWKTLLRSHGLELVSAQGDGLWDDPYVPIVPASVQRAVCDAALALRSVVPLPSTWSSGRFGERLILAAERATGG